MRQIKNILTIAAVASVFFIAPFFARAYTVVTDSGIAANTEWTVDKSPYVITDDFTVSCGMTLTIDPGVVVEFSGRENLYICGAIVANGTSDQKIYFATVGDDSVGAPPIDDDDVLPFALWGIVTEGGTFILNNGEIRDIIYGIDMDGGGLGWTDVSISGDDPTIDALNAPLDFTNVDISGAAGYAILLGGPRAHLNADNVSIHDSNGGVTTWSNGFISGTGLNFYRINGQAIFMDGGSLSISDSTFSNIYAGDTASAIEASIGTSVTLASTTISNIYGGAVDVLNGGNVSISNTTISSSTEGVEINDNVANLPNYNPITVNTISSSTISNIDDDAVDISGTNLSISGSSLTNIGQYAVWNSSSSPLAIAENNFWGDASGPYNQYSNPNGIGSTVSDNVDFSNWLGENTLTASTTTDTSTSTDQTATSTPSESTTTTSTFEPVIIIPGIFGSEEYNGTWVMDPILHSYDDLVATLAANGYSTSSASTTLFTFPYDWKNSNIYTAELLKNKIAEVKTICGCSKVNLVAHSMGGLVARQYIQSDDYQGDVDKVIFLGTPHLGAPEDYFAWEGAVASPSPLDLSGKIMNMILGEYGLHEGYLNLFDFIHDKVPSIQELLPIYPYKIYFPTGQLQEYIPSNYPMNPFLENLENTKTLLDQRVNIFNIVGDIASSTIEKIEVRPANDIAPFYTDGQPATVFSNSLIYSNGDGTVPLSSASDLPVYDTLDHVHTALPDYAEKDIFKILTGKDLQTPIRNFITPDLRILIINLFSPIHVLVTAPDGKRIGYDPTTGQEINEIPGAFYTGITTDNEYVTIPNPEEGQYQVESVGYADGSYTITASDITGDSDTDTSVSDTTSVGAESLQAFTVSSSTILSIDTSINEQPQQTPAALPIHQYSSGNSGPTQTVKAGFDPNKFVITMNTPIDKFVKEYKLAYRATHWSEYQAELAENNTFTTTTAETETASVYQAVPSSLGNEISWFADRFVGIINRVATNLFNLLNK